MIVSCTSITLLTSPKELPYEFAVTVRMIVQKYYIEGNKKLFWEFPIAMDEAQQEKNEVTILLFSKIINIIKDTSINRRTFTTFSLR